MKKTKPNQGTDCYKFELTFEGYLDNLPKQSLVNSQGNEYGYIEVVNGKGILFLILPRFIRSNNIQPFTIIDSIYLEIIKNDCNEQLQSLLGTILSSKVKSIECNITQKVSGNATQSDVLNLLNHAYLSSEYDNIKYVGASKQNKDNEETHTFITRVPHYYTLKAYDKTEQQKQTLKNSDKVTAVVPDKLLRIEIIMTDRTIKKLFGNNLSLSNILTKESLISILEEYKRIFYEDIVEARVKKYLNTCASTLVKCLCDNESPLETIAKNRELIPDKEVLRKALKKWQKLKGITNNSARDSKRYAEKYNFPSNVILTLHDFKVSCG